METENHTEARTAHMAAQNKTKINMMGTSCFDYKCNGNMGASEDPNRLLECNVCGTGLKVNSFEEWITGRINNSDYTARTNKEGIEYAEMEIKELQVQIVALKEANKDRKETIRNAKAEGSKYRKIRRSFK